MDRVNTNLCLENLRMMHENERLRRKAQQLDQENKALLAEIKRKQQLLQQHDSSFQQLQPPAAGAGAGASSAAIAANRKAAGKQ